MLLSVDADPGSIGIPYQSTGWTYDLDFFLQLQELAFFVLALVHNTRNLYVTQ